MHIFVN